MLSYRYRCSLQFRPVLVFIAVLASSVCHAEDSASTPPSEETMLFDVPVVLSASRLSQPRTEAPAAVTVIDRDMIRATGVRTVPELLQFVPGFQVSYFRGYRPVVTYHGFSDSYPRRMQVLVDGRSVYTTIIGGVLWAEVPLAVQDIDHVEVIRGSNSATYGSNAFLGVVNIVTVHASQAQGTALEVAAGSNGIRDGYVRQGWKSGASDWRITAAYQQDSGLKGLTDTAKVPVANLRGDVVLNRTDSLEVHLGLNGERHIDGTPDDPSEPNRDVSVNSNFEHLRWRRVLGAGEDVSVQVSHNYLKYEDSYIFDPIDLSGLGLGIVRIPHNQNFLEERYDIEVQHTLIPFQNWRFVWGGGMRQDQITAQTYFGTDQTVTNRISRLFGNTEWRATDSTVVNGGLMMENNQLSGVDWLPRLAVNQLLVPGHTLRFVASHATRAPSLFEDRGNYAVYYQGALIRQQYFPSAGVTSEKMDSYELGYLWTRSRELAVDTRLFRDRLYNLITEIKDSSVPSPLGNTPLSYRNEGNMEMTGAEVEVDYRPTRSTRVFVAFANMRATVSGLSTDATDEPQRSQDSVPVYSLSTLITQRFAEHWQLSAAGHWMAPIHWLGDGGKAPEYARIDLRLAREFRMGNQRADIAVVAQNLGKSIVQFDGQSTFDRRAYLVFRLSN